MTDSVQGALIVGSFTLAGIVIGGLFGWWQARTHNKEMTEVLHHQSYEKHKDRLAEVRKPYLTALRERLAEILETDSKEKAVAVQFERILKTEGSNSMGTEELQAARETAT